MVGHGNLLANLEYLRASLGLDRSVEGMLWLPPYHDMGLIGGILLGLYNGHHLTLMAPWHFLQRPHHWLEAMTRLRATHTASPNFALDLCVRKTSHEDREALDLSSLRMLLSGGEPVRAETLERFASAFAASRFDARAFTPAYGLAEATLTVTTASVRRPVTYRTLDARALREGLVRPRQAPGPGARVLASCGSPSSRPSRAEGCGSRCSPPRS